MFDHVAIRVSDLGASRRFYELTLGAPTYDGDLVGWDNFFVLAGPNVARRLHLAFAAPDRATVDAFHAAALAAGYRDNGAPGERPQYGPGYYGAFVLDLDGHNVEVVFHDRG